MNYNYEQGGDELLDDVVAPRHLRHLRRERVEVEVFLRVVERLHELLVECVVRVEFVTETNQTQRLLRRQVLRRTRRVRVTCVA